MQAGFLVPVICKIYDRKSFRRHFLLVRFVLVGFLPREKNGRKEDEKAAGPRNPERQPIRKQFSAHLGRSGKSSTPLVEAEKGGGGGSERSHKAAGEKPHPRTRINIPEDKRDR